MAALIIPTLNGGEIFKKCVNAIKSQSEIPNTILVMDSCSEDDTVSIAKKAGFEVFSVPPGTFDHGGTRGKAVNLVTDEIVVFMTQDAILSNSESLKNLLSVFEDPDVHAVFGRQLPHTNATPIAAHARLYNYPDRGYVTSINSKHPKGIRKAYMSNSYAAYRRETLLKHGNFESGTVFGEDFLMAAKLLKNKYKIAYANEATVNHSHNYTTSIEFKRYFDIGVLHSSNPWLINEFGSAENEGIKFAKSQVSYLWNNKNWKYIPASMLGSAAKFVGYQLGKKHRIFNPKVNAYFSLNPNYFKDN